MLKYFIPPPEGLKIKTYYVVEVSFEISNPIHRAILGVGFLNGNNLPCADSYLFNITYNPEATLYTKAYYIKVIREIDTQRPSQDKFVSDIKNIFELEQHNIQRIQKLQQHYY